MNEAVADLGRVRRAGRECVWVMEVMVVLVSVSVAVDVNSYEASDSALSNETRECERCERENEVMLVEFKERVE